MLGKPWVVLVIVGLLSSEPGTPQDPELWSLLEEGASGFVRALAASDVQGASSRFREDTAIRREGLRRTWSATVHAGGRLLEWKLVGRALVEEASCGLVRSSLRFERLATTVSLVQCLVDGEPRVTEFQLLPDTDEGRVLITLALMPATADLVFDRVSCRAAASADVERGVRRLCEAPIAGSPCVLKANVGANSDVQVNSIVGDCDAIRSRIAQWIDDELDRRSTDEAAARAVVVAFFSAYRVEDAAAMSALLAEGISIEESRALWRATLGELREVGEGAWDPGNRAYQIESVWEHGTVPFRFRLVPGRDGVLSIAGLYPSLVAGSAVQVRTARALVVSTVAKLVGPGVTVRDMRDCELRELMEVGDRTRCVAELDDGTTEPLVAELASRWDSGGRVRVTLSVDQKLRLGLISAAGMDVKELRCVPEFPRDDESLACTARVGDSAPVTFRLPPLSEGLTLRDVAEALRASAGATPP